MSTEALLKTRAGVDALREAFMHGASNVYIDTKHLVGKCSKQYPYPTGTRPRVVSVAFNTGTYDVSVIFSHIIRVHFESPRSWCLYEDIFHLAYTLRMDQASFDVIQELIANPDETYELPDNADGAA